MFSRTNIIPINPQSLRQRMIALPIGEAIFVPMDEYKETTVRNYASTLRFARSRKYTVSRDRERRGLIIKREA